ncbi:MAG: arsenite S-adenosylmethyltransferase, partial [Dehalococcoidia bacterium]|nr:arsenite S-adenosylmethyltransferase [Dehalococcoidia bacterium]
KPGGRFAVSDIVVVGPPLGDEVQQTLALWAGCVAGALTEQQYRAYLAQAGFVDIDVVETNDYRAAERGLALQPGQRIIAAFVRATKPY